MSYKSKLAIAVGKITIKLLRLMKLGGTTLPGKIALIICPSILMELSSKCRTIMVTGTNGKTTTTRIIEKILADAGFSYFTNKSGANLMSGITTTYISVCSYSGEISHSHALIEIDEAAFSIASSHVKPVILVVTNFFRDQLDRFGELYSTVNNVLTGIEKSHETLLIINADDSLCSYLGEKSKNPKLYFGFSPDCINENSSSQNHDAGYCIFCKEKYQYTFSVYGHLGGFHCENCGFKRQIPNIECEQINSLDSQSSDVSFKMSSDIRFLAKLNLPGLYNIYNALAATACAHHLKVNSDIIAKSLATFERGFGRMECIQVDDKKIQVILVKNPIGFTQVLTFLQSVQEKCTIAFLINDNYADGTDISWLWDVEFEKLSTIEENVIKFFTSGERAEDMTVRLKYAGIYTDKIVLCKNYNKLLTDALNQTPDNSTLYILPTYTAMLDVRSILKKKFHLKEFWK